MGTKSKKVPVILTSLSKIFYTYLSFTLASPSVISNRDRAIISTSKSAPICPTLAIPSGILHSICLKDRKIISSPSFPFSILKILALQRRSNFYRIEINHLCVNPFQLFLSFIFYLKCVSINFIIKFLYLEIVANYRILLPVIMTSQILRKWFIDLEYKQVLENRIKLGNWRVICNNSIPVEVVRIIYAGYECRLPDGNITIVNPDKCEVKDADDEEYQQVVSSWLFDQEKLLQEKAVAAATHQSRLLIQKQCLHDTTHTYDVVRAAGCDISDTSCLSCGTVLRRSWSTAYDKDPDDHISDWEWFVKEHQRLYNQSPNIESYHIVDSIEEFCG